MKDNLLFFIIILPMICTIIYGIFTGEIYDEQLRRYYLFIGFIMFLAMLGFYQFVQIEKEIKELKKAE